MYLDPLTQRMSAANAQRREMLACGYIRESLHHKIEPPNDIVLLINIWLNVKDKWHIGCTNKSYEVFNYEIENNVTHSDEVCQCIKLLHDKSEYIHAFGSDVVKNGEKQSWILSIIKLPQNQILNGIFGIIDFDDAYCTFDEKYGFCGCDTCGFGLDPMKGNRFHNGFDEGLFDGEMIENGFNVGDKITIELNLEGNNRNLSCCFKQKDAQNSTKMSVIFDDIDITRDYRLCVALFDAKGTQIALVSTF